MNETKPKLLTRLNTHLTGLQRLNLRCILCHMKTDVGRYTCQLPIRRTSGYSSEWSETWDRRIMLKWDQGKKNRHSLSRWLVLIFPPLFFWITADASRGEAASPQLLCCWVPARLWCSYAGAQGFGFIVFQLPIGLENWKEIYSCSYLLVHSSQAKRASKPFVCIASPS